MDVLNTCWRLRDLLDDFVEFSEDGNESEAADALRRIRKTVGNLCHEVKMSRMDSVFFPGELDAKHGERNVLYPVANAANTR